MTHLISVKLLQRDILSQKEYVCEVVKTVIEVTGDCRFALMQLGKFTLAAPFMIVII